MANTQVEDLPGMATRPAVQMPRIFNSLVVKPRVSVWNENRAATTVHNLPAMQETQVQSLGWEDHPGGGSGNPLQYFCLGNIMDGGAWWAITQGVAKESGMT